jgi:glycosyltransferase involved in cell wall biosynthesis
MRETNSPDPTHSPTATSPSDLVSIVLPTHNSSEFIAQSIGSCLEQTYPLWELIVVDDALTDGTFRIVQQFSDPRLRVLRHAANRGLPAALNTGFAAARGQYLTWTSDDNYYLPHALGRMLAVFHAHPDVGFVCADPDFIDEKGTVINHFEVDVPDGLLAGNSVNACFLYQRAVQTCVGRDAEDMRLAEDYEYWLRISRRFRVYGLHETLYRYRRRASTLTSLYGYERARRVVDKALRRRIRSLPWIDARTKTLFCLNEAARGRYHGRVVTSIVYLGLAMAIAPKFAAARIARKRAKEFSGPSAMGKRIVGWRPRL